MLIEYMERFCVGFDWTGGTLVLVNVWMCHYLVLYDASWHHHNWKLPAIQIQWLCADVNWIHILRIYGMISCWTALLLMLIERMARFYVGFGRTESTLLLVHAWIRMCDCLVYDDTIDIAHSPTFQLQLQWHTAACLNWRCTSRRYVGIGACLNWNVSLLGTRCNMTHSPATQIHYNDNHLWLRADVDWIFGTVSCWLYLTKQKVRRWLVLVCIRICHYLLYGALWHHCGYALVCYSTTMAMTYMALHWWLNIWIMFAFECVITWRTNNGARLCADIY